MKAPWLVLVLTCSAGVAAAEPEWAKGVPQEQQDRANALFDEANLLFAQQAHVPALAKYKEAIALWDHPMIRFNMAVAEIRLDRILDAADDLDRALRFGQAPFTPELYARALDDLELIKPRIGTLAIDCGGTQARVVVDGKPWTMCPASASARVLAGEHVIVEDAEGYLTREHTVVVRGGMTSTERVMLVPAVKEYRLVSHYPRWMPWTLTGSGAALAAVGVGVWLSGSRTLDQFQQDLTSQCAHGCDPYPHALQSEQSRGELESELGATLMITGGAVLVGGIAFLIVDRPRRIEVAPTGTGIAVSGRF